MSTLIKIFDYYVFMYTLSVIEGYYVSLQEAGLPLSVCIQLQECRLSLRNVQWTARQDEFWFLREPILARAARQP